MRMDDEALERWIAAADPAAADPGPVQGRALADHARIVATPRRVRDTLPRIGGVVAGGALGLAIAGLLVALFIVAPGGQPTAEPGAGGGTPRAAVAQWAARVRAVQLGAPGQYDPSASPGALAFPAGTSYEEAIRQIFLAQMGDPIDSKVRLVDPLPAGTVLLDAEDGSGVTVDLAAPYGITSAGLAETDAPISWPSDYPGGIEALSRETARIRKAGGRWWAGGYIARITLPGCEVRADRTAPPGRCSPGQTVSLGKIQGTPLP